MAIQKLKDGHSRAIGELESSSAPAPVNMPQNPVIKPEHDYLIDTVSPEQRLQRASLLKTVPTRIMKRAWFTISHLLLDDGAKIIDAGCGDGAMAYVMATFKPEWEFIAYDIDKKLIENAQRKYKRDNLKFVHCRPDQLPLEPNSVDAIVNSYLLHEIYSQTRFNFKAIRNTLDKHFEALKPGGYFFIRDYAMPAANEYVLMEMTDDAGFGDDLDNMSEADLLIWFSDHARSGDSLHTGGFFLEELPPRFPNTRLFRLPYKWAYEFIIRKDDRETIEQDLNKEYTFATHRDLRRELRSLGARLLYSASHWNDDVVQKTMVDKFQLYTEDGVPLGYPETSYILVGQKVPENTSIRFQEWRTTRNIPSSIKINPVRDIKTGEVIDVATRYLNITELLPYRVSEDNRLKIYLHESIPRSLVNTVPRKGKNIDNKTWSGHMIEALSVNGDDIENYRIAKPPQIKDYINKTISLETEEGALFRDGPSSYPDPKAIEERISTSYICVKASNKKRISLLDTGYEPPEGYPFMTAGHLREYDAQSILNAIAVGMLPSGRLEAQILMLYQKLGLRNESWSESPLVLTEVDVKARMDVKDILRDMAEDKKMFAPVKHEAGQLRLLQSVFLEEGHQDGGGMTDISSRTQDFFVHEEKTENVAIIMPMTRDLSGEVLVGMQLDYAPVPERFKGNGNFVNLPSIPLPAHIDNMDSAKRYVAEYFETEPKFVGTLGEPFYQHIGMTPQKVFPFAIANNPGADEYWSSMMTTFAPMEHIWGAIALIDCYDSFLVVASRCFQTLLMDNEMELASRPTSELANGVHTPRVEGNYDHVFSSPSKQVEADTVLSFSEHDDNGSGDTSSDTDIDVETPTNNETNKPSKPSVG